MEWGPPPTSVPHTARLEPCVSMLPKNFTGVADGVQYEGTAMGMGRNLIDAQCVCIGAACPVTRSRSIEEP